MAESAERPPLASSTSARAASRPAALGGDDAVARHHPGAVGDVRPRHQPGVRLLPQRHRRRVLGARRSGVLRRRWRRACSPSSSGSASPSSSACRWASSSAASARSRRRSASMSRRLCHAARRAGAAADAVAGIGLRGEGGGGDADVGLSGLHQHLGRGHRGAEEPDRCGQVVGRPRITRSCAGSCRRRRCPTSWRAFVSRSGAPLSP